MLPAVAENDIPQLLAALVSSSSRVERVPLSQGPVWIKRYGTERGPKLLFLQSLIAKLLNKAFLRPSPILTDEEMAEREVRRIEEFAACGVPTPEVLYRSGRAVVFSDVGITLSRQLSRFGDDAKGHDDLLVYCAAELGALHAAGLCHGRPYPRDMFIKDGRIGYMDFEEEPTSVMQLSLAQARDVWLLFLQLTSRARQGRSTYDRAFQAWAERAPSAALGQLKDLTDFLGGLLSIARLIGRIHMGSDLRRFIDATSYLKHVSHQRQDARERQEK